MDDIRRGVRRFRTLIFPKRRHFFERLAHGQNPTTLFITCADSRVVPNLITQTGPGDLFVERNPGNIVPAYSNDSAGESASIEYAVAALGVKHAILCGHSDCGAIKAILHPEKAEGMDAVERWLEWGKAEKEKVMERFGHLPERSLIKIMTQRHVVAQLRNLKSHPSVERRMAAGELDVHGWVYEIDTGEVLAYDEKTDQFWPWPE